MFSWWTFSTSVEAYGRQTIYFEIVSISTYFKKKKKKKGYLYLSFTLDCDIFLVQILFFSTNEAHSHDALNVNPISMPCTVYIDLQWLTGSLEVPINLWCRRNSK